MNVLRRISAWFDNIDYDRTHDIDFRDDFDPSEPRVPAGSPGGGQWTAGGGVAAPASPALTKYAGPVGAKFKKLVDAHFSELTNSTATPEQVKAKVDQLSAQMKAEAGKFKSSNVAGYINQLIDHLEVTHGYPEGSLGKAVKLKGEAGVKIVPPTDEEIQKMAVAAGAPDIPAVPEPEPAEPAAAPTASFTPQNASTTQGQEAVGKIAEIVGNKWSNEEKIAWITALGVDIPSHDVGAQAALQGEIDKLKGNVPVASGNSPQVPAASGTPPEPDTNSQKKVFNVLTGPLPDDQKIAAIEAMKANYTHQPNIDYAQQAITLLKADQQNKQIAYPATPPGAQAKPAEPKPAMGMTPEEEQALLDALPKPNPFKPTTQGQVWQIASDPTLSVEGKTAQIEQMKAGYALSDDQEYADKTIAALKGEAPAAAPAIPTVPPTSPPTGNPVGPHYMDKLLTPVEQTWLENALPIPDNADQEPNDMWAAAYEPNDTAAQKISKIAKLINATPNVDYKDYGQSLIDFLKGGAAPATTPTPAANPTAIPDIPPDLQGPGSAAAYNFHQMATNGMNTAAQLQDYVDANFVPGGDTHTWAETVIAAKKAQEGGAAGPDLNKYMTGPGEQAALEKAIPMPGGPQAEQDLWETAAMKGWTAASKIKQLEADMTKGGIAEAGTSPQSKQTNAYAQTLIDFLKGYDSSKTDDPDASAATGPEPDVVPAVAISEPVGMLKGSTYAMGAYQIAIGTEDPKTKAEKITKMVIKAVQAGTLKENSPAYNHALGMAVTLNQQASGQTPAAPTPPVSLTKNWPLPSNSPQQSLFTHVQQAATPLEQHQLLNNIATSIASPELKNYAKALKAALGPDPAAATPTAPAIPKYAGSPTSAQGSVWTIATNPYIEHSEKIAQIQAKSFSQPDNLKYQSTVLAALNAGAGKTSAVPTKKPPEPPPANLTPPDTGYSQTNMFAIANKPETAPDAMNNEEKIAAITKLLATSPGSPGGKAETYANKMITALGGKPTTKAEATAAHAPAATPTPAATPKATPSASTSSTVASSTAGVPASKATKKAPHFQTDAKHTYEDAFGNELKSREVVDTKKIPDALLDTVTNAYGDDPDDAMTYQVDEAMMKAGQMNWASFNSKQQAALTKYKGAFYDPINDYLRGLVTTPQSGVKNAVAQIRAAMKTAVVPARTPVWRGLRATLKELTGFDDPEMAVGRVFVHRNFASVSRSKSTAKSFGEEVMMHINLPAGTPGVVLRDQNSFEREIVMPDHSVFRIDKCVKTGTGYKGNQYEIEVTLLGQQEGVGGAATVA